MAWEMVSVAYRSMPEKDLDTADIVREAISRQLPQTLGARLALS